jgi:carboxylesterase
MIYNRRVLLGGLVLILLLVVSCTLTDAEYDDTWLDGDVLVDTILINPENYLVSAKDSVDPNRPVVIAVHGFSATTYEWLEFAEFAMATNTFEVSRVLMGGHGRSYEEFKASTWQDWGAPIVEEYNKLVAQGFQNISLVGSSTGGALLLKYLAENKFKEHPPKQIFLVDPIVIPGDKFLSLMPLVGGFLGNVPTTMTPEEQPYWYRNRPAEALQQLNELIISVRKDLAKGIVLPSGTRLTVFKSQQDEVADPASALLIYKGVRLNSDKKVDVILPNTSRHVYTRLRGRIPASLSAKDTIFQSEAFQYMADQLVKHVN